MFKNLAFFIILASVSASIDQDWWISAKADFYIDYFKNLERENVDRSRIVTDQNKRLAASMVNRLKQFLERDEFLETEFYAVLGSGSYGTVLAGRIPTMTGYKKVSLKLMWETSKTNQESANSYKMYKALADAGVPFLIRTEKPICEAEFKSGQLCGMEMERAYPLDKPMFKAAPSTEQAADNTDAFVQFVGWVLYAFKEMHFKAGYSHCDIKPANLMFVQGDSGALEPRLIDFDLTFDRNAKVETGYLTYTPDYRPPELKNIAADNKVSAAVRQKLNEYRYSTRFLEDSYALGKTLKAILNTNKHLLKSSSIRLTNLEKIFTRMMAYFQEDRIDTSQAYQMVTSDELNILKDEPAGMVRKYII